jgi:tetratricopeptide (TPR) repeat protein
VLLLAEIYRKKGELKRASDLLHSLLGEKRLLSDREMAAVYESIGEISNKQSLYERARDALNRSIALAEKDRESKELLRSAYAEMGNSYHFEGRHKEAIRHYGQSLDLDYSPEMKGYWDVKYRLALSYLGAGESGLASRLMNEILEEGDPALQQKVQIKMGSIPLEKELKRLSLEKAD